MSRLAIFEEDEPRTPIAVHEDGEAIAGALRPIGVRFERWPLPAGLDTDAEPETILAAFRGELDRLMGEGGAGTADVIRLRPGNPAYPEIRRKFLDEHTHTEDEVRFFVRGQGRFVLHEDGRVYDVLCTEGDLISVPHGTRHWFDAGDAPDFTVLRVFTDTTGWTPHYTGSRIAERFTAAE
jgi:1,2-dihydroxy-3-keto-5-methylthiopentene dioxygenase